MPYIINMQEKLYMAAEDEDLDESQLHTEWEAASVDDPDDGSDYLFS